jgi:hypothetical protein
MGSVTHSCSGLGTVRARECALAQRPQISASPVARNITNCASASKSARSFNTRNVPFHPPAVIVAIASDFFPCVSRFAGTKSTSAAASRSNSCSAVIVEVMISSRYSGASRARSSRMEKLSFTAIAWYKSWYKIGRPASWLVILKTLLEIYQGLQNLYASVRFRPAPPKFQSLTDEAEKTGCRLAAN